MPGGRQSSAASTAESGESDRGTPAAAHGVGRARRRRRRWAVGAWDGRRPGRRRGRRDRDHRSPFGTDPRGECRVADNAAATALATVTARTLSGTTPVSGTLGYAGGYTVLGGRAGGSPRCPRPGR